MNAPATSLKSRSGQSRAVAYEKNGYTLYAREQPLRKGKTETVFFFSKREPIVGNPLEEIPDGYVVSIHGRTGVPYLKKK